MSILISQGSSLSYSAGLSETPAAGNFANSVQPSVAESAKMGAAPFYPDAFTPTSPVEFQKPSLKLSRLRDLDEARASTQYARNSLFGQPRTAMLAHANQSPQSVLKVLR